MDIGLVGDGPAIESVEAALGDVEVNVLPMGADPDLLAGVDFAVVAATTGDPVFATANEALDAWIAIEIGGIGGHPIESIDAAVTVLQEACYDCLRRRVAAGDPETCDRPTGVRSAVRYAGAVAGRHAIGVLSGGADAVRDTVVEIPGPERTLLPVPGCACAEGNATAAAGKNATAAANENPRSDRSGSRSIGVLRTHREASLAETLDRGERAVDDRIGPIETVGERESFPVPYYIARTADTRGFSDVRAAEFAAGVDVDWDAAFMKALGEGLERYAAGVHRAADLERQPLAAVDDPVHPDAFVTPERVAVDPNESIPWVSGVRLDTSGDEPVHLPAEFVHFPPPERRFRPSITTGLGVGSSGVDALLSGLYETIERDATMVAWYSTFEPLGLSLDGIADRAADSAAAGADTASDPDGPTDDATALVELRKRARAEGLTVRTVLVTTDVDVPVVAAAVHRDGAWPRFAAGSAADLDPIAAARSAVSEALQNWMELRSMGPEAAATEGGAIAHHAEFPDETRRFFDPETAVGPDTVGKSEYAGTTELDAVLDHLDDAGLTAYAARLTTRDLETLGFEATRVLVPSAQPLFTGDPFFGDRARSVPATMGFEPDLDREYHPFP
ncbi:ribosomal protein S12 methylthiotransferase accessory factor [Halopenitus malekzadehii]|uniref:Ribosomal protein S12 methylthiotransferase accessory factor n=1 Tax=Halopenitus malekzadehii TaxID=1267564 RepID=A0A1H6IVB7_9EURY|nr:YcaO-like family protein [Halopenitus malekzadehii]SEH51645.1 ribosomal protein S12 methylthiotransferase accessory factor [Halopenitus malekzadehii]